MSRFSNPLFSVHEAADPFLMFHEGLYYLASTRGSHLSFYRAETLAGLGEALEEIIWQDNDPLRHTDIWAPEFFHLEGRWWCYYTASNGQRRHRCLVLRGHEHDLLGPYEFQAQLVTDVEDKYFSLDFSLIQAKSGLYGVWAAHPRHRLWIARMSSPFQLSSKRVLLEADGFGCKKVREGPNALVRNGRVFLVYSACDARLTDYKLGMLVADESADLTDPANWTQHPEPVFASNEEAGVYGPGHQFFFKSPDGTEDWMSYHAKTTTAFTYGDRVTCAKPISWNDDGTPNLGRPPAFGAELDEPSGA